MKTLGEYIAHMNAWAKGSTFIVEYERLGYIIPKGLCQSCGHVSESCPYVVNKRRIPSNSFPGGDGCIEVIDGAIVDCVEYIEV